MKTPLLLLLLPLAAASADLASADVLILRSTADTSLEFDPTQSVGRGGDPVMNIGVGEGLEPRRMLVRFDVAAVIPQGAIIHSVTMRMEKNGVGMGPPMSSTVHRLMADWGEEDSLPTTPAAGDATWEHSFFPQQTWSSPGGDFDPAPSTTALLPDGREPAIFTDGGLIDDVQGWVDGTLDDFGWIINGDEAGSLLRTYHTRELRPFDPILTVTFSNMSPVGDVYCEPGLNGSSQTGTIAGFGSDVAADNNLTLVSNGLPLVQFGFYLVSRTPSVSGAQRLCLGGAIGRLNRPSQILNSGLDGRFELRLDLTALPQGNGLATAVAGDTWYFQAWHRDFNPPGFSNFTNALEVTFF